MIKVIIILFTILVTIINGNCQYHPSAGKNGSSAIFKDSSLFVNWANHCTIKRGWKDIAQKDSGFTTTGDSISPTGKAGENGIVSLGDSGIAICNFDIPIADGQGWDFAIFENAFDDNYLELAFVEVSSDGRRYFRFPCHSLSDTSVQTPTFGYTNPEKINNLAGKYRASYGTPFDISEIPDYKDLDKNNIKYVKIIDVVGTLNTEFASLDTAMRKINDPYPTLFASGGFDLDAIGVINEKRQNSVNKINDDFSIIAQNPLCENHNIVINIKENGNLRILIFDYKATLFKELSASGNSFEIKNIDIPSGIFIIKISGKNLSYTYKGFKI